MMKMLSFFLSLVFLSGCTTQDVLGGHPDLPLLAEYNLNVPEPSGLSFGEKNTSLYTVSDATGLVYRLSLQGKTLATLAFEGSDLEGVAYDSLRGVLWVVEEGRRDLVRLDLQGNETERFHIDFSGPANSGLEGVAVNVSGTVFVLNEKKPPRLLELNSEYGIAKEYAPGATSDYSGLCADTLAGRWWVLSDQDATLFLWDSGQGVLKKYYLGIPKAEGLAIDFKTETVYVVSDSKHKLYVFALE